VDEKLLRQLLVDKLLSAARTMENATQDARDTFVEHFATLRDKCSRQDHQYVLDHLGETLDTVAKDINHIENITELWLYVGR